MKKTVVTAARAKPVFRGAVSRGVEDVVDGVFIRAIHHGISRQDP
jgi:hypothetical protein